MEIVEMEERELSRTTESSSAKAQIALLTPYSGGNLGDAAIQDSVILNLQARLPGAEFLGITLNCANFVRQHGTSAFPMLASNLKRQDIRESDGEAGTSPSIASSSNRNPDNNLRRLLRKIPGVRGSVRSVRSRLKVWSQELSHWKQGYRLLRSQDVLLLSGGGQLDEEYGGAWRLPYAYFKWALLARLARVPCAMVSVGAGKIESIGAGLFFALDLRMCC
jgi:polysaccharide pyruvyl transferase WcaK-like protein